MHFFSLVYISYPAPVAALSIMVTRVDGDRRKIRDEESGEVVHENAGELEGTVYFLMAEKVTVDEQ